MLVAICVLGQCISCIFAMNVVPRIVVSDLDWTLPYVQYVEPTFLLLHASAIKLLPPRWVDAEHPCLVVVL